MVSLFRQLRHKEVNPTPVTMSKGATKFFTSWYNQNQDSIKSTVGMMKGVYTKMPLQLARLTLIIHCLEHPDNPSSRKVSAESMSAAISLVEYFKSQATLALKMIGVGSTYKGSGTTAKVFQILSKAGSEWSNRTTLHQGLGSHTVAEVLNKSLEELEAENLIQKRKPESTPQGGRRGEEFRILPLRTNELSELTSLSLFENEDSGSTKEVTI